MVDDAVLTLCAIQTRRLPKPWTEEAGKCGERRMGERGTCASEGGVEVCARTTGLRVVQLRVELFGFGIHACLVKAQPTAATAAELVYEMVAVTRALKVRITAVVAAHQLRTPAGQRVGRREMTGCRGERRLAWVELQGFPDLSCASKRSIRRRYCGIHR